MGCRTEPAFVHIGLGMQKLHFFQFFNFFLYLTRFTAKKNYATYRKKKLHDLMIFLNTSFIFHLQYAHKVCGS